MIQKNQFLKNVYAMTPEEKKMLDKRMRRIEGGEASMEETLVTLSCMSRAHGFINMAHKLTDERVKAEVSGFVKLLRLSVPRYPENDEAEKTDKEEEEDDEKDVNAGIKEEEDKNVVIYNNEEVDNDVNAGSNADHDPSPKESYAIERSPSFKSVAGDRPQHFDEWKDRMSDALREKVYKLKVLHTMRIYYRQMVERIAADPNHSKTDLAMASTLAVNYENKILSIYAQADIEWDELQGRTVSDETKKLVMKGEISADRIIAKTEPEIDGEGAVDDAAEEKDAHKDSKKRKTKEDDSTAQPDPRKASQMTDEELKKLTVMQLMESNLDEGPRMYFINIRLDNAKAYIKRLSEKSGDKARSKARTCAEEIISAGKKLTRNEKEHLALCGIYMDEKEN